MAARWTARALSRQAGLDTLHRVHPRPVACSSGPFEDHLQALPDEARSLGLGQPDRAQDAQHVGLADRVNGHSSENREGMQLEPCQPLLHLRRLARRGNDMMLEDVPGGLLEAGRGALVLVALEHGVAAIPRDFPQPRRGLARLGESDKRRRAEPDVPALAVHHGAEKPPPGAARVDLAIEAAAVGVASRAEVANADRGQPLHRPPRFLCRRGTNTRRPIIFPTLFCGVGWHNLKSPETAAAR
jgi:hypothetical protein